MQPSDLPGVRMLARLFAVLLLTPLLLPLAAAAAPSPMGDKWVESSLALAQPTLTRIEVSGDLLLHKHPVGTRAYTAAQMGQQYQGATSFDEGQGPTFAANLETAVRAGLEDVLATAFPGATRTITLVDADEASLTAPRTDPYDPPVRVRVAATVERTRESAGLGSLSDAALDAVFAAGGRVRSALTLSADPGYDLTYVLHPPASPGGLAFSQLSTGAVALDGSTVTFRLDNAAGSAARTETFTIHLFDPSVEPPMVEAIATVVEVRLGDLARGQARVPLDADVTSSLRVIAIAERFPGALPPSVTLDHVTAEGLRALRQAGAVGDASLAAADAAFLDAVDADLASSLGADAAATGGIDRADLAAPVAEPYGEEPPVLFHATALGAYAIPGDASDADLALKLGGTVRLDLSLASGKGETTYRLHPPAGAQFFEPRGGTVTADGLTATFVVPAGADAASVSLALRRGDAPSYTAEEARLGVLIDLRDVDVSVGQAMGGDFGTLLADVTVRGDLSVLSVPDAATAGLGPLDLDFVDSDGVRLLLERGVLTPATLQEVEASLLDAVRSNLARSLGADVDVTGGFDEATLAPGLVSSPPNGETPIVFEARASFQRPLGGASQAQAAIALYSVPQTFTFPRVRDLDTTYTVVLPRGLAVTALDATNGEAKQTEWSDGRQAFTVRPTEAQAETSVTMSVTPTFVLFKFWPLVLGAVVVLVLAVGTPIALVVLRRRKA